MRGTSGGGEGERTRFRIQAAGATRRKWEMAVGMATTLTVHYKKINHNKIKDETKKDTLLYPIISILTLVIIYVYILKC